MVTRGIYNLHVDGKWYRWFHRPRAQAYSPDTPAGLRKVRAIISETRTQNWEPIPFPTPLHLQLDYIYNIDKDSGLLTIIQWEDFGAVMPRLVSRQAKLATIQNSSLSTLNDVLVNAQHLLEQHNLQNNQSGPLASPALEINIGQPTPLNELQFRFFTDFVFIWRFYFDDIPSWANSSLLNTLAIGLLRIAAWDFEIVLDTDTEEVPVTFSSVPNWSAPSGNIFWFHGFLVTLYSGSDAVEEAILNVKSIEPVVHVILISLGDVTFAEISSTSVSLSSTIPLVVNSSAIHPSPGFRLLVSILTSPSWKMPVFPRETWNVDLTIKILDRILHTLRPKDIISFARASFAVERWYYSSLAQLGCLHVQDFKFSMPCCGEPYQHDRESVYCSLCYTWNHEACVDAQSKSLDGQYTCSDCQQNRTCKILEVGGIHREWCKKPRKLACKVIVNGAPKTLDLRLGKPASRRPQVLFMNGFSFPPKDINYTIWFNGRFSGLAYGLEEP